MKDRLPHAAVYCAGSQCPTAHGTRAGVAAALTKHSTFDYPRRRQDIGIGETIQRLFRCDGPQMIGFTAERLMALEVEGLTGAAHGERSPERITHRNGYRERSWETTRWIKLATSPASWSRGGWPRRR